MVTRFDGGADILTGDSDGSIVAGNGAIYRWLIELIRKS
jgi:hypothetical protein